MTPRLNIFQAAPEGIPGHARASRAAIEKSGLEHGLLELVRLRASQINGCAFCLAHARQGRAQARRSRDPRRAARRLAGSRRCSATVSVQRST